MLPDYDVLIRAGRIVCPASGFDSPGMVAVRGDRIVAVGPDVVGSAQHVLDFPNAVLLPGLIDLHAHPACSGSIFGVDPDQHMLARGTTTVLSQGDAGSNACETFVRETIGRSQTQVILAINLSATGEAGPSGCFERIDTINVAACVSAIDRHRKHIWGIAINTSHRCCGQTDPHKVLLTGLLVAAATGLPILYGMRRPEDWPLREQLVLLRPGDVVTYCFRSTPHCIVDRGRVLSAVRETRYRGILFDVGHGCGSFDFSVAEAAVRDGFPPDTISTDLQRGHIGQTPTHDLPLVMSKLRSIGMVERDIFAAVTSRPARTLGLFDEIGSLKVGSRADLCLLRWHDSGEPLVDVHGQQRSGGRWESIATIRAGRIVPNAASQQATSSS
ncbi:MAG: amidohydrolase family protein [Planctomycetales bacterium]|nr:amidohydrolase family protein [Planctomycetales bacterium]